METSTRQRSIDEALCRIEQRTACDLRSLPTGISALDSIFGGGLPRGRMVEIFGPPACGKTSLALAIARNMQQRGLAAFIDADHALDAPYARALGVDVDNLLVARPVSGEKALEIAATLAGSGVIDLIVLDSVAALAPHFELEAALSGVEANLHSQLISQGLRKLCAAAARSGACLLLLNQLRFSPGAGGLETSTGGWSLKLRAAIRAGMLPGKPDEDARGRVHIRVSKNCLAPPSRAAEAVFVLTV